MRSVRPGPRRFERKPQERRDLLRVTAAGVGVPDHGRREAPDRGVAPPPFRGSVAFEGTVKAKRLAIETESRGSSRSVFGNAR